MQIVLLNGSTSREGIYPIQALRSSMVNMLVLMPADSSVETSINLTPFKYHFNRVCSVQLPLEINYF